jgi:hypothetical protein
MSSFEIRLQLSGDGVVGHGGAQEKDEGVVAWALLPAVDEVPDQ